MMLPICPKLSSVAHRSTVDEIRLEDAYAPETQELNPDGSLVPFMTTSAIASSNQLPYTYAYIQRLSFGSNTRDTCTAVATGIALNYLDNAIDGAIVPNAYQAEPLKNQITTWQPSYTKTKALYDWLLNTGGLDPVHIGDISLGSFADSVVIAIAFYRNKVNGVYSTLLIR